MVELLARAVTEANLEVAMIGDVAIIVVENTRAFAFAVGVGAFVEDESVFVILGSPSRADSGDEGALEGNGAIWSENAPSPCRKPASHAPS